MFKQKFEFFWVKEKAEKIANLQKEVFESLGESYAAYIGHWFPASSICQEVSQKERAANYLNRLIGSDNYIHLSHEDFRKHMLEVKTILNTSVNSPNSILHAIDSKFNSVSSKKTILLYYGEKDPRIKKKSMKKR